VMEALLRKSPSQRPPSAMQVLQSLGTAVIPEKVREVSSPSPALVASTPDVVADPDVQMMRMKPVASTPLPRGEVPPVTAKPRVVSPSGNTPKSFLEDRKKVMLAALGIVLLGIIMTALRVGKSDQPLIIQIDSVPPGATIVLDGKSLPIKTPYPIELSRTTAYEVSVILEGYESPKSVPLSPDADVPEDNQIVFELHPVSVAASTPPAMTDPPPQQPPPQKVVHWKLPPGLEPDGSAIDESTGLPLLALATKLKAFSQRGDVPLAFVLVLPGEFEFGATPPLQPGEIAARHVTISKPFYFAVHELTNSQRAAALGEASVAPLEPRDRNLPAVMLSHADAVQYCQWLGAEFELPSEEECEWVARGSRAVAFPWGIESPSQTLANLAYAPAVATTRNLKPVEELAAGRTPTGVSHLLGNVAEWCSELYVPGDGEDPQTTGVGVLHTIRGASFRSPRLSPVRITWRANARDRGYADIGVRIVARPLSIKEAQP